MMKKTIAVLLAASLLLTAAVALAEGVEKPYIDFDIRMDRIPDGYGYTTREEGGSLFATFSTEDPDDVVIYVSVAYSDAFAGYTMTSDLTEEEMENAMQVLGADYNMPAFGMVETDYGTGMIRITENDAQSDYADFVTVWHGYLITLALQKNAPLTDADMDLAVRIASDMWIVEQ